MSVGIGSTKTFPLRYEVTYPDHPHHHDPGPGDAASPQDFEDEEVFFLRASATCKVQMADCGRLID